jgi:hypothetical protein
LRSTRAAPSLDVIVWSKALACASSPPLEQVPRAGVGAWRSRWRAAHTQGARPGVPRPAIGHEGAWRLTLRIIFCFAVFCLRHVASPRILNTPLQPRALTTPPRKCRASKFHGEILALRTCLSEEGSRACFLTLARLRCPHWTRPKEHGWLVRAGHTRFLTFLHPLAPT